MNIKQAKIFFDLGTALAEKGKWQEAIAKFDQAIKLAHDLEEEVKPHLADAKNQLQQQEANDNLTMVEQLEKKSATQETDLEEVAVGETIKVDSNMAEDYHLKGDDLVKEGKKEEAIIVEKQADKTKSESWEYLYEKGNLLQEKGQLEAAVDAYKKSIELNSDSCWSYNGLGDVLVKLEKWEEAVIAYRRTVELNPDFPWGYYKLGDVLVKLEDWQEAVKAYRQAVAINPPDPCYLYKLAKLLLEQSQIEESVEYLYQAVKLKTDEPQFYQDLTTALVKLEEWSEAEECLEQVIKLSSNSIPKNTLYILSLHLGKLLTIQGKWKSAIAAYNYAIGINYNYTLSYENLGDALQERGFLDHAFIVYQKANEFIAEKPQNHLNGKVMQLENKFKVMDNLFLQLDPSQLTSRDITINAEFPLTPTQGFYSQDYDQHGMPLRWTIPRKPFEFNLFCDRTSLREIQLYLVTQSIDNVAVYCIVEEHLIKLQKDYSKDENYLTFTDTLLEYKNRQQTQLYFIAVDENYELNLSNLSNFLKFDKDKIVSVPFSRLTLK